jgi:hypothetical protein
MSTISLNENQIISFQILEEFYEKTKSQLSQKLTFDSLVNEANILNYIESKIPSKTYLDLHLDLILKSSGKTVTQYYKSISSGSNSILEAARKIFLNDTLITESIESFKTYLVSLINEEALTLGQPVEMLGDVSTALSGGTLKARKSGSFWETLKKLWNAATEGGSAIGILHFVLDIIGIAGDFIFPAAGVVADIINAIIYAIRGEYLLASVSLIAAIFIGSGDALKLAKGGMKAANKVFTGTLKGGSKETAQQLAKIPAKQRGPVVKILSYVFGNIGSAVGKSTSLLGRFVQGFGKVTGYIPGLGRLLEPIIGGLGKVLKSFGDRMAKASSDWVAGSSKVASQTANTAAKKQVSKAVAKSASEGATKLAGNTGIRQLAFNYFKTTPLKKMVSRLTVSNFLFFIGKQIYKIVHGTDWVDGGKNAWTKSEVEGHGNGAFNNFISQRLREEREKTGATYVPAIMLDSQDKEALKKVTDYQNHFAKELGQPSIMQAVTKKYDEEGVTTEFDSFFDAIAKGTVTRGGKGDIVASPKMDESFKIKTLKNFSDF